MRRHLEAILLSVVFLAACETWTATPVGERPHESLSAVLWMRTSAEYYALTEQAYGLARMQVDEALRPENAALSASTSDPSLLK